MLIQQEGAAWMWLFAMFVCVTRSTLFHTLFVILWFLFDHLLVFCVCFFRVYGADDTQGISRVTWSFSSVLNYPCIKNFT